MAVKICAAIPDPEFAAELKTGYYFHLRKSPRCRGPTLTGPIYPVFCAEAAVGYVTNSGLQDLFAGRMQTDARFPHQYDKGALLAPQKGRHFAGEQRPTTLPVAH